MNTIQHKRILIIADIEGSSGCNSYQSTQFMGQDWPQACLEMTRDVNTVARALFKAGVEKVVIKDFHRTGYNLYPSRITPEATLISGYRMGPVPGIGSPHDTTGLIMMGMHAPSGSNGFLAHTLTSKIVKLKVNGRLMSEAQLFSASLAPFKMSPLFFSGCPVACDYAAKDISGIQCFPISTQDRSNHGAREQWRLNLQHQVTRALFDKHCRPYTPAGPFHALVTLDPLRVSVQDIAVRWGYRANHNTITIKTEDIHTLYMELIKIAYFTPLTLKLLPLGLPLYNLVGKTGLMWANHQLKASH